MKDGAPVINVTVVCAVPAKVRRAISALVEGKEEDGAVETVLAAELRDLLRRRLIAQNGNRRVAGHQFD